MTENPFRQLPALGKLLADPRLANAPRGIVAAALREEIEASRLTLSQGGDASSDDAIIAAALARLAIYASPLYPTVINATGIVLHTNLGRAPMAEAAAKAAYQAARHYLALEIDLVSGERSSRQQPIRDGICRLTGAESATAVNNCAAATVIALRALAAGKEVIVSRGQLIEIGGNFRIPEIMAASGAILKEVGTTNITRLGDYEAAISPNTAAIMRVHCSNYRIRGFTEAVGIRDLAALGQQHGIPVIDDVGSGAASDFTACGFEGEPTIREGIAAGADLVLFSGDKLLGGPQAGLIAGKAKWIDAIERDPLMRAFRLDKMTLAALAATLALYRHGRTAEIPTLRMLAMPHEELRARSLAFAERLCGLEGLSVKVRDDVAYAGGGSLADQAMLTVVLALHAQSMTETQFAERLRMATPAVLARTQGGRVLLDLRTVFLEQDERLAESICSVLKSV